MCFFVFNESEKGPKSEFILLIGNNNMIITGMNHIVMGLDEAWAHICNLLGFLIWPTELEEIIFSK